MFIMAGSNDVLASLTEDRARRYRVSVMRQIAA